MFEGYPPTDVFPKQLVQEVLRACPSPYTVNTSTLNRPGLEGITLEKAHTNNHCHRPTHHRTRYSFHDRSSVFS